MKDRKVVAAMRRIFWPELREHGFSQFTDVAAWRYWDEGIDVVWSESVGARFAYIEDIPKASFGVGLSIRLNYLPDTFEVAEEDGRPIPEPAYCQFRRRLHKTIEDARYSRRDTWRVEEGRENVPVWDATNVLVQDGLPWFERYRDPQEVLRTLEEDDEEYEKAWGFNTKASIPRQWLRANAALRVGDVPRARTHLEYLRAIGTYTLPTPTGEKVRTFWTERAESLLSRLPRE